MYLPIVHMNLFQLMCVLHDVGFSRNKNVHYGWINVLFTLNRTTHSSKTLLCVVRFNVNKTLSL